MKKHCGWALLVATGIALVLLTCGCEDLKPMKWVAPPDIGGWWQQEWYETLLTGVGDIRTLRTRSTIAIVQDVESIEMVEIVQWEGLPNDTYYFKGTYRNGILDVHQRWTPEYRHLYRFLSENQMVALCDTRDDVTGEWVENNDDPEQYRDDPWIYIRKGGEKDLFPQ